ncbi:MAG: hypothetical protein HWN81_01960, partial [Candidatus Lokiarchaeota archaeon]|nr:hypothetical protein [Candidatus Lokiarchaeota archaeon]
INEARSSARPSLLASRQLSQIDTRLREVNDSISSLNQQQGTDGANREEIKAKREKLEAEKKELEARRTAATQLTESTGILKLFNDILKKVKDFFGRFIPGFRTAEEVGQQGEAFPTSRATQEDIARANERTADVSFEDRLEERRLAAYYDYELQLIDTNSTAERRGLERQLELRLEALTITQQIADISSKGIDNLNEEELKQLRLLSLKQEEILKRQPSVKDRIFDEIAVDPKGAVDNVNNTLVKGAKDFTDALVNGIEAAVVEGKDLGDTLRGAATEFLRELTRTNLRNAIGGIASIFSGGPTTFEGSTNPAARGGSPQNAVWTRSADIRIGGSSRSNSGGLGGVGGECSGNGCIFQDPNYGEQSTSNSSSTIGDIFKKIFDGFKNSFSSIFNGLKGILGNIGSSVGGFFGNLFGFEKGGKVTGGSGSKDDVPAMLMGGEFVMNRNSVQKYGPQFMEAVNSGKLQKFATGGIVDPEKIPTQNRTGNYFAPGIRGTGKITGAQALRSFATQGFTVGETDFIGASGAGSSGGAAFIDLEPESIRLTNRGRTAGTPLQLATQDAKQQAFDLALQDERLRAEIKAEEKRQKEEFKRAVISTVASAVISYGVNVGVSGYKNAANAYTAKAGAEATTSGRVWEGLKGVWGGGTLEGGGTQTYGGFANLFNGRGTVTQQNLANYWANNISDPGAQQFFKSGTFLNSQGSYQFVANNPEVKKVIESGGGSNILSRSSAQAAASSQVTANSAILRDEQTRGLAEVAIDKIRSTINAGFDFLSAGSSGFPRNPKIIKSNTNPPQNFTGIVQYPFGRRAYLRGKAIDVDNIDSYATGGSIPNVAGIDTVPAMLSGGEFIVNSAAADRLGQANLERINAGEDPEDQRQNQDDLTEKLDELIKVTKESTGEINITVNGDGSATEEKSGNSEGEEQNVRLARVIRDQVLKVIQDEKRLGGTLRRGL